MANSSARRRAGAELALRGIRAVMADHPQDLRRAYESVIERSMLHRVANAVRATSRAKWLDADTSELSREAWRIFLPLMHGNDGFTVEKNGLPLHFVFDFKRADLIERIVLKR